MNKTILCVAIGSTCIATTSNAIAALSVDAWLQFDPGVPFTTIYGSVVVKDGSYFGMDTNGGGITPGERTAISQNEGLFMGIAQAATGSHGGAPDGSESSGIDAPWEFFSNTGLHWTSSATTVLSASGNTATVDFSGWTVTWNGIPAIDMGGGAQDCGTASDGICVDNSGNDIAGQYDNGTGIANIVCGADCSIGDPYTLTYDAVVPQADPSGFGGVSYTVYLEGTIGDCTVDGDSPIAGNDNYNVATDTVGSLIILANDADVGCSGLDKASVDLDPATVGQQTAIVTANGSITVNTFTGVVTYTPNSAFQGLDGFTYTVNDRAGNISAEATVDLSVGDLPPTCNDDGVADGAYIDITQDSSVNISVLDNDIVGSNLIDVTTVSVINDVAVEEGATESFSDGTITFTPAAGFTGTASFTYNVSDGALTCADATVNVLVSEAGEPIGGVPNAYLVLASGPTGDVSRQPVLGEGSWFSMETSPGTFTYVPLVGLNHIQLGTEQPASSGPLMPNIDNVWIFFGNPGVHQTTGVLNQLSNDGVGNAQLDFSVWDVSWNGIASIPMGAGPDNGIATVTCYVDLLEGTPGTCADGDEYLISYRAIVPPGDASGFGGVNYTAHLEGTISATAPIAGCGDTDEVYDVDTVSVIGDCTTREVLALMPGATADAAGNTTGLYLSASDIGSKDPRLNPNDGEQCVGGCLDFVIDEVASGEAQLVVKLDSAIPDGATYRKLINGKWRDFDVSGNDVIGSSMSVDGKCLGPDKIHQIGLRAGSDCLYLKIIDGGANDADNAENGTIIDPSGVLLSGSPNVPASDTGGCSISKASVKPAERADWFILAGFIVWLGLLRYREKSH